MKRIFKTFILPVILIVLGVVIIAINIASAKAGKSFVETTGTIADITVAFDPGEDNDEYTVYVDYSYEGKDYRSILGEYRSSFEVGDEVGIKVNPENPDEIRSDSPLGNILGIGLGVAAILAAVIVFFKGMSRR